MGGVVLGNFLFWKGSSFTHLVYVVNA